MKKQFTLFLFFILLSSLVSAERFVNYNFFEGNIDTNGNFIGSTNPVTDVNVVGYVCKDENCETLGKKIFIKKEMINGMPTVGNGILNSKQDNFIQLNYPTELLSQYGYALYYYRDGFIPWESNPNWFGTDQNDPQGPFNVYLTKKEVCSSEIAEFTIRNSERINTPVVINVKADIDANTKAAINNAGPLNAIPEELKEQYSVKTLINLNIIKNEIVIFSASREISIEFGKEENIEFSFIPDESGDYNALLTTKVTDGKCTSSLENSAEKEFIVLEENPLNACYTELGNLELSSVNVKSGHDILIKLNKISNFQEDIQNEIIVPIETSLNIGLINDFGEKIHEENFVLASNENSLDVKKFELQFNIPESVKEGFYNLIITGTGNNVRCSNDNKEDKLSERIFVENGNLFGAPEIISEPITKAKLGETYVYDVTAIDPNNDVLNYNLLVAPQGMTINSETGLINWNVNSELFNEGERHFVFIIVSDGFFFDLQFFFVDIEKEDIGEKKESKNHEFGLTGLDLEFSDTKNGITGFLLLKNSGDFKENKVSIYADIYELDVHEVLTSNVNLGKEDSFWIPVDIKLPSNVKEGEYLLNIRIENSKHKEEQKIVVFIENNNEEIEIITQK